MTLARPRLLLGILFLYFISCSKVNVTGPQGTTGPPGDTVNASKGDVQGYVALYDVYGNPLSVDSGATVSIDHSSPAQQTVSGLDGSFTFTSLPSGNYNLTVSKSGFGTMRLIGFQNAGTATPTYTPQIKTAAIPPYTFGSGSADTLSEPGGPGYPRQQEIKATLKVHATDPAILQFPVMFYLFDSASVSPTHFLYQNYQSYSRLNDSTVSLAIQKIYSIARLDNAPYLYVAFAIDNPLSLSYTDENGIIIHPCVGSVSQVFKVFNNLK